VEATAFLPINTHMVAVKRKPRRGRVQMHRKEAGPKHKGPLMLCFVAAEDKA